MRGSVVVAGGLARRSDRGGHTWALLQWVLGFRYAGWEVLFLDRLEPGPEVRGTLAVRRFVDILEGFGLGDSYSLDLGPDEEPVGLGRTAVRERLAASDFLLNVMGYLEDEDLLGRARRRVFLDIDPGFGQMWKALGLCDLFVGHDAFLTVGGNVGRPSCRIPDCGLRWIPTLPPVVMDLWRPTPDAGTRFTSVGSWRGPWDPVVYEGTTYGLRVHEFRRFATLPRQSGLSFEVALDIGEPDDRDAFRLLQGGWHLESPERVASTPDDYRDYVRLSRAEFTVAKGMYVQTGSGWFSDRTACYLAAGRPAVVQDTGLAGWLDTGLGLLTYTGMDEAVDAVRTVDADWSRHARAARDWAARHLDANRVVTRVAEAVTTEASA